MIAISTTVDEPESKANLPNQNCLQAGNPKTARLLLFDKLLSGCISSSCDGVQA